MIKSLRDFWQHNTLLSIMLVAIVFRLLAAIFSKGYSMNDDHFVVIHVAQRWIDGFNDWFDKDHPSGFSLVYTGLHYLLFYALKTISITDPVVKMYFVRILHAAYSLLTVYFGYRIALQISNKKIAVNVGILLAIFWFMPFMSVRNLNEMVCVPPLMAGFYFTLLGDERGHKKYWIYAGILFGLAFAFRYQTILIPAGVGLVLLIRKNWKYFAYFTLGTVTGLFILQGMVDWVFWGKPFAAFVQYTFYNVEHRYDYIIGPWYNYTLILLGILIPPMSIAYLYGYIRLLKKIALLFWPVLIFFVFHSMFPNKQERFILPIIAIIITLGSIGWQQLITNSPFWKSKNKLLKISNVWFWSLNTILLLVLTFTFTKKTLVEPMIYLSKNENVKAVIFEYDQHGMPWFPRFYMERKIPIYRYSKDHDEKKFVERISTSGQPPNYVFFFGQENLDNRKSNLEQLLEFNLIFDKRIDPSLIDFIVHKLNPKHNLNLTSYIYKVVPKLDN